MSQDDEILELVRETLRDCESRHAPLSSIIMRCIRISRLRKDFINYWWLSLELINIMDKEARSRIIGEIIQFITREEFNHFDRRFGIMWIKERPAIQISDHMEILQTTNVIAKSIGEIESDIESYTQYLRDQSIPPGLHPLDLYIAHRDLQQDRIATMAFIENYQSIIGRVNARAHDFLSKSEQQILFSMINSDIFANYQNYVIRKLSEISSESVGIFNSAYQRMNESNPESWAQALTSCRRLLKTVADYLYPPRSEPVIGSDGRERILSEEAYVSRLWQFVTEKSKNSTSGKLLLAEVSDIGNRIDKIYGLSCKGVHDKVGKFEVDQCVIQVFMIIGELLRLNE
jgi:hypothetical protein